MFSKTEMSEVLTEIVKMDPNFDKEKFIKDCQYDFIPNILEVSKIISKTFRIRHYLIKTNLLPKELDKYLNFLVSTSLGK